MENANPNAQNDLIRLRTRLLDLQRSQKLNPESFALYQQTILQLHQETESRKQSCFSQAQTLRTQAAAIESQGHAFSSMASILFSVVNGYVLLEEKRIAEEIEREKERLENAEPEPSPVPPPDRKKSHPKKKKVTVETPVAGEGPTSSAATGDPSN